MIDLLRMGEPGGKERTEAWQTAEQVKTSRTPEENEEMVSGAIKEDVKSANNFNYHDTYYNTVHRRTHNH